ncbi:extracellular solute-binding protein [Streptacidiphilus sp. PB12-B1b]|uniref:ABC transporter substrate-binding protein n=1 Tax=Streptacidiphilus sp. PB12-B1b TaxID=2705012 RepID=UPI0015FB354B|nr:extracellular solute-binding protein [Streptacidiphilus sp. PB12-B1b]QMU74920.1 extracellular solute-binding protein [Streptacidiphilus sp. PB12-B1b]
MLALSALGVAGAMALTACGSSSSGSSKSASGGVTTINLLAADYGTAGTSNSSQTYWQGIADAFHKANPSIIVHVQTIAWTDWQAKTTAMFQAKQYPDILEGDAPQEFAADNLLYPLSDVMSSTTVTNLIPVFEKQEETNGVAYGAPFTTSARAMFYNKKLFAQAKIQPPTTWAQLQSDAAAIKALPGGNIGYDMPLGPEEAQGESLMWMLGNDGNYTDGTGKYAINSANNIATFQFMAGLVKAGDTEAGPATQDRKVAWQDFANGTVGMVGGSGALIPIIQAAGKLQSADYGVVAMPGKSAPLTSALAVHDDITAFKTGGHAAQIKAFLDFAYQDKYQEQFDNEYDLLPATTSASAALSASNPVDAGFLAAVPNAVQYPTNANWTPVLAKIQNTIGAAVNSPSAASGVLGQLQTFANSSN